MRITKYDDSKNRSLVSTNYFTHHDRLWDRFDDIPPLSVFKPIHRRLFDSTLYDTEDWVPRFVENRLDNTLEYHIPTVTGESFKPEDLQVSVRGRDIEVKARKEEKSLDGNSYALREVRRTVRVPYGVDVHKVAAELRSNGKIIVKAPTYRSALTDWSRDYGVATPLRVNKVW